jgi:hypothetical protein
LTLYANQDDRFKKLGVFLLHFLRLKGLIGKGRNAGSVENIENLQAALQAGEMPERKGYLSKEAYLLMLLSFLLRNSVLVNVQNLRREKPEIELERLPFELRSRNH